MSEETASIPVTARIPRHLHADVEQTMSVRLMLRSRKPTNWSALIVDAIALYLREERRRADYQRRKKEERRQIAQMTPGLPQPVTTGGEL